MAVDNPFRFVNDILNDKKYILNTEQDEKDFIPFLINRALTYHLDTVLYVREIAQYQDIPNRWLYDYYFHSIRRQKRRYGKWPKKEKDETTQLLMEYYQVNRKKAEDYQSILNDDQIASIKADMEQGGFQ